MANVARRMAIVALGDAAHAASAALRRLHAHGQRRLVREEPVPRLDREVYERCRLRSVPAQS